jgi:hypothetical protein
VHRSLLDFGREAGLAGALVAADAALRLGLTDRAQLATAHRRLRGRAGWPGGARLIELADGRSESPLESVSRIALASSAPELQVVIRDLGGSFVGRVDFFWPELGVVGEADGRSKYRDDELWQEKLREERLTDLGLVVLRWGWTEALRPAILQERLSRAFDKARMLRYAGYEPRYVARLAA